jgi:hypothetical protein
MQYPTDKRGEQGDLVENANMGCSARTLFAYVVSGQHRRVRRISTVMFAVSAPSCSPYQHRCVRRVSTVVFAV